MGYQQSLRASEMGLTLNVDVASTAFVEPQPVRSDAIPCNSSPHSCNVMSKHTVSPAAVSFT